MADENFWDALIQEEEEAEKKASKTLWGKSKGQEEGEEEESGNEFLYAYDLNDHDAANDPEGKEWDYGEESEGEDGEFNEFIDKDPYEFGVSYAQLGQVSYGDPGTATMSLGGKFSKIEKIVQAQTVSKEKLYLGKLKVELNNIFDSFDKANHYATLVQQVPRFWLKNGEAIAATFFVMEKLEGEKLTANKLASYSTQTGVDKRDIFRYYRLLKEYT